VSGVEDLVDGDGFIAVWTVPAEAEPAREGAAVLTPLDAEEPGLAVGAFIDDVFSAVRGSREQFGWPRCGCVTSAPSGLAAGI